MSFPLTYFKHPQWSCIVVNFDGCTVGFIVLVFPVSKFFESKQGNGRTKVKKRCFAQWSHSISELRMGKKNGRGTTKRIMGRWGQIRNKRDVLLVILSNDALLHTSQSNQIATRRGKFQVSMNPESNIDHKIGQPKQ